MNIQNTLLGLLLDGSRTGYELKQQFDSSLGFFAGASFGSIYPILRRCEKQGLVRMDLEIQDGKPNRKIYRLTPEGRKAFLQALSEELVMSPYRNEFLSRLFFFGSLDNGRREELVREYLSYIDERIGALTELAPMVEADADAYQELCYQFGIRYVKDLKKNARWLLGAIEKQEKETTS